MSVTLCMLVFLFGESFCGLYCLNVFVFLACGSISVYLRIQQNFEYWLYILAADLTFQPLPDDQLHRAVDTFILVSITFIPKVLLLSLSYNLLVECRTLNRKVTSSNPGRSGGKKFFSRVNFVCWLLLGVRSTHVLPQWHIKDPRHWLILPKVQVAGYT